MARAKAKGRHAGGGWTGRPFRLPDAVAVELLDIAGLDPADDRDATLRLLRNVERLLGAYPGMVEAIDNAPRPAHVAAALEPVAKHAAALGDALDDLDATSRELLADAGVDVRAALAALDHLEDAAHVLARDQAADESRHGRTRVALRFTVARLLVAFADAGGDLERTDAERASLPFDFARTALGAAGIPFSDVELRRLVNQYMSRTRDDADDDEPEG